MAPHRPANEKSYELSKVSWDRVDVVVRSDNSCFACDYDKDNDRNYYYPELVDAGRSTELHMSSIIILYRESKGAFNDDDESGHSG